MTVQPQHRHLLIEDSTNEKLGSNPLLPQHTFDETPATKEEYRRPHNKGARFTNVVLSFASSKDSGPPSPVEPFPMTPHRPSLPPVAAAPSLLAPPPTLRRTNSSKSLDSESLYSASSAPRSDAYDVSYQSWQLASIPGSPNMGSFPAPPRRGPLHLVDDTQGGGVSTMREALAPETYVAHRLRESSATRAKKRRSRSDVIASTRLPPLPPTAPFKQTTLPPSRLQGRPHLPPITIPDSNSISPFIRPLPVPQSHN